MSDTASQQKPSPYIRRATAADSPVLSSICLATADAGISAEHLHSAGELPGLIYAEPYVHLPTGFGFVLVDPSKDKSDGVVGYVLSTYDTRQFEHELVEKWLPPYLQKYPLSAGDAGVTDETPSYLRELKPDDKRFVKLIHNPQYAPEVCTTFSPAHMHINILPAYHRQGWGRKLIGEVVRFLRDKKGLDALWLGLDPRNGDAKKFYGRLGFKGMPEAPGAVMSLKFADWTD